MPKLTIKKVNVISTSGKNNAPISGDVEFSDGHYDWYMYSDDEPTFMGRRKIEDTIQKYSFQSPKRAKLLKDWLNNEPWSVEVINVSL